MGFTPRACTFLGQLAKNNDKAWFEAHKDEFETHVREPALAFIEEAAEWFEVQRLPYVAEAKKAGGSLSRIHRDTRFGADKSPYNTHMTMAFHHRDATEDRPLPGLGIRWDAKGAGIGGGLWMADTPVLNQVRDAIVADGKGWTAATKGLELWGESLKTAPRGYPKDHPLVADLRRTSYAVHIPVTKAEFTGDLMGAFQSGVGRMTPFLGFLEKAVR